MRTPLLFYTLMAGLFYQTVVGVPVQQQQVFMSPDRHGEIWSLCGDPSTHTLRAYEDGVSISPTVPQTGQDINVKINGNLCMCLFSFPCFPLFLQNLFIYTHIRIYNVFAQCRM
jgi:hypothetical protein